MQIRILLVGLPDFLSDEAATTAVAFGIKFLGPYEMEDLPRHLVDLYEVDGVVIDIRCDGAHTVELIESCSAEELPCIIALNHRPANAGSAYILSEQVDDLREITLGLLRLEIGNLH